MRLQTKKKPQLDLAIAAYPDPLMWRTGIAAAKIPPRSMMTYPSRLSASASVPMSQTRKMATAPMLSARAGDIPRTMSSVMCNDINTIVISDVVVSRALGFIGSRGGRWISYGQPIRLPLRPGFSPGRRLEPRGRHSRAADHVTDFATPPSARCDSRAARAIDSPTSPRRAARPQGLLAYPSSLVRLPRSHVRLMLAVAEPFDHNSPATKCR